MNPLLFAAAKVQTHPAVQAAASIDPGSSLQKVKGWIYLAVICSLLWQAGKVSRKHGDGDVKGAGGGLVVACAVAFMIYIAINPRDFGNALQAAVLTVA